MTTLEVRIDPADAGFDPTRLSRIDDHFRTFVDDGRLAGWMVLLARRGEIVHLSTYGHRDREAELPMEPDTIFRMYSMSKAVTSVAAMMLYEEGAFELKDPVAAFIPSFADTRVFRGGNHLQPVTEPVTETMRIWHLLTHTAGLTYGFQYASPVDAMYRAAGFELGSPPGLDLAGCCDAWAALPLLFQPGTEWSYSVATDVLGRVVEVASGMSLDRFFDERILGPLGMVDTGFHVPPDEVGRLAALYVPAPDGGPAVRMDALGSAALSPPSALSGGGGLVGTAADYHRFVEMLRRGGEFEGERLLGSRTVDYMATNHLPGGADLEEFGRPLFSETTLDGTGFGLGFAVVDDPVKSKVLGTPGTYHWGGAASTAFWVDPVEEITGLFLTQLLPSNTYPIRSQLSQLVYQALVD